MYIFNHSLVFFLVLVLGVFDASIGLGYGTALTPLLLVMSFNPLEVVPVVLASQIIGDFVTAFFHHKLKNVDLSMKDRSLRVAIMLAGLGSIGSVIAAIVATNLPSSTLKLYIGSLITITGLVVLATKGVNPPFSWNRIVLLGLIAAFK